MVALAIAANVQYVACHLSRSATTANTYARFWKEVSEMEEWRMRLMMEQTAEDVETRLGVRMRGLEDRIDYLSDEFYSHCDEADEIRAKLASLLEDTARSLQFCRSTEEVVEVLTNLLSELARLLR